MYNKNFKPTFGISFGLPQQGGGGYPINLHSPYPLVNPYGSTIGASGINLGLVSVNPLISIQVSKDDYGEKVVKPFINLHVTPNDYLVHKFEDLLDYKKDYIYNKHQHIHHHHGPYKHLLHKPFYHHRPFKPVIHSTPVHLEPEYENNDDIALSNNYYDDPLNYGGGSYGDDFLGRTPDFMETVSGNPIIKQYNDKLEADYSLYADNDNLGETSLKSDVYHNNRRGKSFENNSNLIKFPNDRKRRDLTENETARTYGAAKVGLQEIKFGFAHAFG